MISQRDMYTTTEEDSLDQPSVCQQVYALMRCPGPPCYIGPYCWQDSVSKKRYRLKTHHFKALVEYVEQGGRLQSQDDIPDSLRQQLFAEEQQYSEQQQRKTAASAASCPPISITNVMPTPSPKAQVVMPFTAPTPAMQPASCVIPFPLEISGPRDVVVKEYLRCLVPDTDFEFNCKLQGQTLQESARCTHDMSHKNWFVKLRQELILR